MYVVLVLILLFWLVGERCKRKICWDEHFWVNSFTKNLVVRRTTGPQLLVVLTYFLVAKDARALEFCYPAIHTFFQDIELCRSIGRYTLEITEGQRETYPRFVSICMWTLSGREPALPCTYYGMANCSRCLQSFVRYQQ